MDKLNYENITKSFFLGIVIGILLQLNVEAEMIVSYRIIMVLVSGSLGFIIGFVTEFITSFLPVQIAKTRTYFFINNMIALVVTLIILLSSALLSNTEYIMGDLIKVIIMVLFIVSVANVVDYKMFQKTQKKLHEYQTRIKGQE